MSWEKEARDQRNEEARAKFEQENGITDLRRSLREAESTILNLQNEIQKLKLVIADLVVKHEF